MSAQLARRFLILGAPGSGKSTIAERIIKTYALPHIVVGNLLRQQIQQRSGNVSFEFFCLIFIIIFFH